MMPNDLQPGTRFRFWYENAKRYRVIYPRTPISLDPSVKDPFVVVAERLGKPFEGVVDHIIPGVTEPYLIHTSVFFTVGGNLLLHPEIDCDDQGFEIVDG